MSKQTVTARGSPPRSPWYSGRRPEDAVRETLDPYRIWVSEIMLQQTGSKPSLPTTVAFSWIFPMWDPLARAPLDAVLKAWEGLGYYSRRGTFTGPPGSSSPVTAPRCRARWRRSRRFPGSADRRQGRSPRSPSGRTCRSSDANARRVVARLFAVEGNPRSVGVERILWKRSASLVQKERSGHGTRGDGPGAVVCLPNALVAGVSGEVPLFLLPRGIQDSIPRSGEKKSPASRRRGGAVPRTDARCS